MKGKVKVPKKNAKGGANTFYRQDPSGNAKKKKSSSSNTMYGAPMKSIKKTTSNAKPKANTGKIRSGAF